MSIDRKYHILKYYFVYVHSQVLKAFIKFDEISVGSDVMSKDIYIKSHNVVPITTVESYIS